MLLNKSITFGILFSLSFILAGIPAVSFSAPKLKLSPNNLPDGAQNSPYSETLTGSGGTAPYTWTYTGALPPGLMLTPAASPSLTATIMGTPAQTGTFTFTVTLSDNGTPQDIVSQSYTVTITQADCYFPGSNTGTISFDNIDPSTAPGPISGTVTQQVAFICKNTFPYTVTANPASGWTLVSGSNVIPFTLGYVAGGVGTGAPVALFTNTTQIIQADYMNAPAGFYRNDQPITFTITWTGGGGGSITATLPVGSVSGSVIPICTVSQTPGTLTFIMDPSASGVTTATVSPDIQIKCTKNNTISITAESKCGGAAPELDSAYPACGGATIPYIFNFLSNTTGQGFGMPIPLNLGGSANSSGYVNAPVGNYGDLQTLTITY